MEYNLKVCLFEEQQGLIKEKFNKENLKVLGFDVEYVTGDSQRLIEYFSANKVDILVVNLDEVQEERFNFVLNIIYRNYCSYIILFSQDKENLFDRARYHKVSDKQNFDLQLGMVLLDTKREIEMYPSRNIAILKSKVSDILLKFCFSSRHNGFRYYIDAVILAYMKQPYEYSVMDFYKRIGLMHGKTAFAVEKSMRTALIYAYNKLKDEPVTSDNRRFKSFLTYDMNNNATIHMLLLRLLEDEEISKDLAYSKSFYVR